ncbi:MAG TPA: ATP-binding protein [Anaerolineales bacterium]|nr:ATP-binding protein [Anaerolineales bacterium]
MRLIIFSGLPGTGKSTVAERLGRQLGVPVFAKDWLEATLFRSGLVSTVENKPLGSAGYELLSILAERQLMLGQSVILDSVAGTQTIRTRWHQLANQYEAEWRVIECVCSDENLHRSRLKDRQRRIPGWYELEWADVKKAKQIYLPWEEEHLVLDMVDSVDENVIKVHAYCE